MSGMKLPESGIGDEDGLLSEGFRFPKEVVDGWLDAREHRLIAGIDYPRGMTLEQVEQRLERAARSRGGHASVYRADGDIHIIMCPWPRV